MVSCASCGQKVACNDKNNHAEADNMQAEDSINEDAVELIDCQSDTSMDAALQQTALFCDQLGGQDDD